KPASARATPAKITTLGQYSHGLWPRSKRTEGAAAEMRRCNSRTKTEYDRSSRSCSTMLFQELEAIFSRGAPSPHNSVKKRCEGMLVGRYDIRKRRTLRYGMCPEVMPTPQSMPSSESLNSRTAPITVGR